MGGRKSTATDGDLREAWESGATFKSTAARLRMAPGTLRDRWKAMYGEEAFVERGRKLQAEAIAATSRATAHTKVYRDVEVPCSACGCLVTMKSNQAAQLDRTTFRCEQCSGDRNCPVCGKRVDGERGLSGHFRHRREAGDVEHPAYLAAQEDALWAGKVEPLDYVTCRECGLRSTNLTGHIRVHGIGADEYHRRHGVDARLRCEREQDSILDGVMAAHADGRMGHDGLKAVACPGCGREHDVSKYLVPGTHDLHCDACRVAMEAKRWEGLTEPYDYVTCRECGYRAENLTSHVQSVHPALVGRYHIVHAGAFMVAWGSAIRDKTALKGRLLSDETKALMSANAGRWNAGLTKETDERIASAAEKMVGRVSWCRGLTKETDERLQATAEKLRAYVGSNRHWGSSLKANLAPEDFEPYLDEYGLVDRRAAEEGLGLSWPTLLSYMRVLGLATSDKYRRARADRATIRIEKDELLRYALGNGKVSIGAAMSGLGRSFMVVARECKRHELPTFHRRIRQTLCLDAVAKALGGAAYVQEWETMRFTNPKTGRRFRFDGYYKDCNLIVEFHGSQHYTFPNAYMLDESYRPLWEESCWRDEEKVRLATGAGINYLIVREDEPFTDPSYLAGRLVQMGVLAPGSWGGSPGGVEELDLFG